MQPTETTKEELIEVTNAWERFLGNVRSNRLLASALVVFGIIFILALLAPLIAPYSVNDQDFGRKLMAPGSQHWFGTDELGRDIFSQILHGALTSLWIGLMVVIVAAGIGVPVGLAAGYFGGWIDTVLMRVSEVFLAFPPLLLPILITASLGKGLTNAMIALAISWFPWYARTARATALGIREELYVKAAIVGGASHGRLIFRHILPNATTPIIVQGSMDYGYAILAAAGLSFIGMGVQPPDIEWGLMVSESMKHATEFPWTALFPGLAIFVTVMAVNLLGDGLRDALDPTYTSER